MKSTVIEIRLRETQEHCAKIHASIALFVSSNSRTAPWMEGREATDFF